MICGPVFVSGSWSAVVIGEQGLEFRAIPGHTRSTLQLSFDEAHPKPDAGDGIRGMRDSVPTLELMSTDATQVLKAIFADLSLLKKALRAPFKGSYGILHRV